MALSKTALRLLNQLIASPVLPLSEIQNIKDNLLTRFFLITNLVVFSRIMGMGCSSSSHVIVPVSEEEALCRTGENCMNATDGVSIIDDAEAIRLFQMAAQKVNMKLKRNTSISLSPSQESPSSHLQPCKINIGWTWCN